MATDNAKGTARPWTVARNRWTDNATTIGAGDHGAIAETGHCSVNPERDAANAALIVRAVNAHEALVEAVEHFREWWANHFDDFDAETNAQLLCLDNEASAALKLAQEGV